jgi:multisubunit Na+/H+ antiporter MnhB subunit
MPEKTGIPVLDEEKKTGGHPKYNSNYNNLVFVGISKQYLADALAVLRLRPGTYARTVGLSFGIYFLPANEYTFFEGNRNQMRSFDNFYNLVFFGQLLPHEPRGWRSGHATRHDLKRLSPIGFFLIVGFVAFLICGWRRLKRPAPGRAFTVTLVFIYLTVIYVTVVANLVEIGENNRFRFIIDPLILIGLGLCFSDIVDRLAKPRPARSLTGSPKGGDNEETFE